MSEFCKIFLQKILLTDIVFELIRIKDRDHFRRDGMQKSHALKLSRPRLFCSTQSTSLAPGRTTREHQPFHFAHLGVRHCTKRQQFLYGPVRFHHSTMETSRFSRSNLRTRSWYSLNLRGRALSFLWYLLRTFWVTGARRGRGRMGWREEGRGGEEEEREKERSLGAFLAGPGECSPKTPSSGDGPVVPLILSRGRLEQEIQNNLKVFSVFLASPQASTHTIPDPRGDPDPIPNMAVLFSRQVWGRGASSGPVQQPNMFLNC